MILVVLTTLDLGFIILLNPEVLFQNADELQFVCSFSIIRLTATEFPLERTLMQFNHTNMDLQCSV